ncbi:CD1375 family protein [Paenibacillus psychroresistens]|nr:CD1375 family protein [Paenibacillus psychroresistens]
MAKIYFNLIKEGRRTIDQVPEAIKEAVQALLNEVQ